MATTTNYSWTTPDDTGLVKDGASAIRTLGTAIDTTTKNLNPSTTLGDIEYRSSSANTNTRLGIGTTGQVLTVSGGVPAWTTASSGGMTLLSTTTLSGSSTSITSISGSYTNLLILINDAYASGSSITVNTRFNTDTGNNYSSGGYFLEDNTNYPFNDNPTNQITVMQTTSSTTALNKSSVAINVYNYTSTGNKFVNATSTTKLAAGSRQTILSAGHYGGASAISSIQFTLASGTWSGGTVLVYGVK